jgi:hypothetical protein
LIGLEGRDGATRWGIGGFSGEGWTPQVDIRAFVSLIFEIVVGHPATLCDDGKRVGMIDRKVPEVVLDIIDELEEVDAPKYQLDSIFSILEKNNFQIVAGVDSAEIVAFVHSVEQSEE